MNKQTLRRMVGGGLFAAIIVVLQLIGGGIRFGTFSISLVLVPIVVGTAALRLADGRLARPRVRCGRAAQR